MKHALVLAGLVVSGAAFVGPIQSPTVPAPVQKTEEPIPKNLDEALAALDRLLPEDSKRRIREGNASVMSEFHFGLGTWMRNNWGLWKGGPLATWFQDLGVIHPDEMSSIILDSFWRKAHNLPIDFEGKVREVKAAQRLARAEELKEEKREAEAKITIRRWMLGVQEVSESPIEVRFSGSRRADLRSRYAAPFLTGVLLTAKETGAKYVDKEPDSSVRTYFLDLRVNSLRQVAVAGGQAEDSVVIGKAAYVHVTSAAGGRILRWDGKKRSFLPKSPVPIARLGIERDAEGEALRLLASGSKGVARWTGSKWENVLSKMPRVPYVAQPPEMISGRLVFHDEGHGEVDKRLSWIDLKAPHTLQTFDGHVGVVGQNGPRWENVWDFARTRDGAWWISTGSGINRQSLVRWTPRDGYRVALLNESTTFTPEFFFERDTREFPTGLALTALTPRPDGGLDGIGPHGFFTLRNGRIERRYRFGGKLKDWMPTTLLPLGKDRWLMGGHFGGLFILEKTSDGARAVACDDRPMKSVNW